MTARLWNKRYSSPQDWPDNAVYIGRPSKWGNPFVIGKDGNRREVIRKYREWILTQPDLLNNLDEIFERDLICWCAPDLCHGSVLIELAEERLGRRTID